MPASDASSASGASAPARPPPVITSALLSSIRRCPNLPADAWYLVASVTLSVLNRPDEIPKVFRAALNPEDGSKDGAGEEHGGSRKFSWEDRSSTGSDSSEGEASSFTVTSPLPHADQLRIARKMRESLVKAAPIGGLPKAINALYALKGATPTALQDPPMEYSPTSRSSEIYDVPSSSILHRGATYFDKIYGKVAKRVMGQMDRSGTEDLGLTARLMYGYLLSNLNVLSGQESSFVLIAGLIPQDVNPQLKGHLRGALNHGATIEEVNAVRAVVMEICQAAGMSKIGTGVAAGWGWRGEVAHL